MRTPVLLLLFLMAVAGLALAVALLPSPGPSSAESGAADITAGQSHTCAVLKGGEVKCWGNNFFGQLGNGSLNSTHLPTAVAGLSGGAVAVAAGTLYTCVLTGAGGVKCWGRNSSGQLGDGTTGDSNTPVDVFGLATGVSAIAAADRHACAAILGGGVKCWGSNGDGQLGDGTTTARLAPVDVLDLTGGAMQRGRACVHAVKA